MYSVIFPGAAFYIFVQCFSFGTLEISTLLNACVFGTFFFDDIAAPKSVVPNLPHQTHIIHYIYTIA